MSQVNSRRVAHVYSLEYCRLTGVERLLSRVCETHEAFTGSWIDIHIYMVVYWLTNASAVLLLDFVLSSLTAVICDKRQHLDLRHSAGMARYRITGSAQSTELI